MPHHWFDRAKQDRHVHDEETRLRGEIRRLREENTTLRREISRMKDPARRSVAKAPEIAVHKLRKYAESRVPLRIRDQVRNEVEVRGSAITVFECRPPWRPDMGTDWTRMKAAQLRFDASDGAWTVYWADRNGRWLP